MRSDGLPAVDDAQTGNPVSPRAFILVEQQLGDGPRIARLMEAKAVGLSVFPADAGEVQAVVNDPQVNWLGNLSYPRHSISLSQAIEPWKLSNDRGASQAPFTGFVPAFKQLDERDTVRP